MKLRWQKHHLMPNDLSHAHHNGYSILWARSDRGRFTLGDSQYEVMPGEDDIIRFDSRVEMTTWLQEQER